MKSPGDSSKNKLSPCPQDAQSLGKAVKLNSPGQCDIFIFYDSPYFPFSLKKKKNTGISIKMGTESNNMKINTTPTEAEEKETPFCHAWYSSLFDLGNRADYQNCAKPMGQFLCDELQFGA